ncbi:MAG: response regulator transcription factor [Acidobacteriota bacterium]
MSQAGGKPEVRHLLIIEDEADLAMMLRDRLEAEGFRVSEARSGEIGLELAAADPPDLVLLDLMLPGANGFEVCKALRRQRATTPIIMLTARGELSDRVLGLQLGADDYLTKPFEGLELVARIEALLRRVELDRQSASEPEIERFGEVEVDRRRGEVRRRGRRVHLAAKELELLSYFLDHPGEVLSRERLLDAVWGYDAEVASRTVDVHLSALRHKLEEEPSSPVFFRTLHRRGYKFEV